MKIAIACDHAGYELKLAVLPFLTKLGYEVQDLGADTDEVPSDYPDFAKKVAEKILSGEVERGVLVCGSGAGVSIAANKIKGIYAAVCHDTYTAHQCVEHDGVNVICIGSRVIGIELAREVVKSFLHAQFTGEERHVRRVGKIKEIESQHTL
jgi:ribose 5-phosphate isomerase B